MQQVVIHIGYPRAGSTFLQNYFSLHPDIFFEGSISGNYKQTGIVPDITLPDNKGTTHAVISEEQFSVWNGQVDIVGVRFKFFDVATQQRATLEKLYRLFPTAKILVVTRGFSVVVKSMYAQYVKVGGILTFADFQKEYALSLGEFYNYDRLIECCKSIFGEKQVLVKPFEFLQASPALFMSELESDLALKPYKVSCEKLNASLSDEESVSYQKISSAIFHFIQWMPYFLQKLIYGLYVWLLYKEKLGFILRMFSERGDNIGKIQPQTLNCFKANACQLVLLPQYKKYKKMYEIG